MCFEKDYRTSRGKTARPFRAGFSLVEIMIVIVIIGLMAGMVTVNVRSYLTRAKTARAKQDIAVIAQALSAFYTANDRYPTSEEGLAILAKPSDKLPEPPLDKEPVDPWNRPYQYVCPGTGVPFEVICFGADGREGGDGVNADITSSNLNDKPAAGAAGAAGAGTGAPTPAADATPKAP
jgi:general secretion pathway protein G